MPLVRTPRPNARLAALAAAAGLLLAGCVAPKEQTTLPEVAGPSPSSGAPQAAGQTLEDFYAQDVVWSPCGEGMECATVSAPLDWDAPENGAIQLALQRSPAAGSPDERIGSLFINPGGPGVSGVEFVVYAVQETLSPEVVEAFDVVGFDPRGVGASTPVECGNGETLEEFFVLTPELEDQDDVEAATESAEEFGETCLELTGPLLGEVDTVSAARDLDLLRAVVGDEDLYYAGFSYGTFLGATYAELYPENVGRLLLDGALDPSMTIDELVIGQAVGFEEALRAYVADCQAGRDCPLQGDVDDGMQQIADLIERIEAQPLRAGDGNELNATLAFYGIVVTLYDDASWGLLTAALTEALRENTGTTLLELANFYLDRTPDGRYTTNAMEAFTAINCLDYPAEPRTFEELEAFAEEVAAQAPTFGRDFALAVGCEAWPIESAVERGPITAAGAPPILVVGTTGDPATPYEWSVALAEQLESGVLLSWEGEGHTAYGRSNDCVTEVVDAYLLRGEVPPDGLVC